MPVFNSYIATRKTSRRQNQDSSAGAAKVPRVGVNKSDLEAQGIQNGWTAGPLAYNQVREMSSSELRWHEIYNATNLENALALPGIAKERKNINAQWAAKSLWDDRTQPTPEQADAIVSALERFRQTYPQFIPSRAENSALLEWLKDRNLHVTFENLQMSFEDCALKGLVHLNPSAIALGSQTDVSGDELLHHQNFHKLVLPQKRVSDVDRLSADEYLERNKDVLADKRVPPIIAARNAKAASTAAHFQQADRGTAKSGSTSVTEYSHEQHGVPPSSEKYSFQRLINSLSAEDFARRVKEDPQFAAAIDKLNNGNK